MSSDDTGNSGGERRSTHTADGTDRRTLLKSAGAAAGAGALGSLAGCAGGGGSTPTPRRVVETKVVKETVKGEERTVVKTKIQERTKVVEKEKEDKVVNFWSAVAVETPPMTKYYRKEMREFEEIHNNEIIINLQGLSYNNLKTKYATTVEAGAGIPDLAEAGTFGLEQWHAGNVRNTGDFVEETEGMPENIAQAQIDAAQFQGEWWSAFHHGFGANNFAILNSAFEAVGVQDPHEELQTWTQVRRVFDKIQNQKPGNVQFAHEVTGTTFDVEQYWGKARTSYTGGTDPWLDVVGDHGGSYENPYIKVNDQDRTDGMILSNIDLGQAYSSPQHPNRSDEECYPLMVQGTLASQMYGSGVQAFKAQKEDITFGWPDGFVTALPLPRLDANYGDEYDLPMLAGKEGAHGAHTWSLEQQHSIQQASQNPDDTWTFQKYHITDERFLIPLKVDPALEQGPPTWVPLIEVQQQQKFADMRTQPFENGLENLDKYGDNYITTGALWDVPGTNNIRWKDLGTTLGKAYAKEFPRNEAPSTIKQKIVETLRDNDVEPANP